MNVVLTNKDFQLVRALRENLSVGLVNTHLLEDLLKSLEGKKSPSNAKQKRNSVKPSRVGRHFGKLLKTA